MFGKWIFVARGLVQLSEIQLSTNLGDVEEDFRESLLRSEKKMKNEVMYDGDEQQGFDTATYIGFFKIKTTD